MAMVGVEPQFARGKDRMSTGSRQPAPGEARVMVRRY